MNQLIQFFECPVCLTYMLPPIFQCVSGHAICARCNVRLNKCPLCRGRKGARAFLMERLSLKIEFPCQYAPDGCTASGRSNFIKTHEVGCQFSHRLCPQSKLLSCRWTGMLQDLVKHFTEKHPHYMFFQPEQKLVLVDVQRKRNRQSVAIVVVYDTTFLFCWEFNKLKDEFRFCVAYYGCPDREDKFSYSICIVGSNEEVLRVSSPCRCIMENNVRFMRTLDYLKVHYQVMNSFFTPEGSIRFIIKIRNNDLTHTA